MSTLIAYYSFEGNCRALAEKMAAAAGAETEELLPMEEPVPRSSFGKYFYGGKAALFKETTPLRPLARHPRNYDLVIVGGPVWFGTITHAVRSFICDTEWTDLRVGLYSMHRGGRGRAIRVMRSLIEERGGTVVGTAEFVDLRRGNADATVTQACKWIAGLATSSGQ